jgi:guanylate kinase
MAGALIFLLVGPSGTGKTTLMKQTMAAMPDLQRYVTCTTRSPRPDEVDGVDYYFLSRAAFERLRQRGELVECQEFYGHLYGSRRADIEAAIAGDADRVSSTDVLGAETLQAAHPDNIVTVFIVPPDAQTLRARIRERENQTAEEIRLREERFDMEMAHAGRCQYAVLNRDLSVAQMNVESIVRAARCARYARSLR